MKHNVKELLKIANNQYNFEMVIRHNKRLEKTFKKIIKELECNNSDFIKIYNIEREINLVKKYI